MMVVPRIFLLVALWAAFLLSAPGASWAQSTAAQVQPGTVGVSGCPSPNLTPCFIPYSSTNPLPIIITGGGGTVGFFKTVNAVIAVTGTAVQLASTAVPNNGLACFVVAAGSDLVSIGTSSSVTNPQATPFGSGAVGTYEVNGQGWAAAINNANLVYINGTAGDGVTCWGN